MGTNSHSLGAMNIYWSMCGSVCGFTAIAANCAPMEVVDMLNSLYPQLDRTMNHHDVYKVATIGDAYQIASGVPFGNGNKHAKEIAVMALKLHDVIRAFDTPKNTDGKLKLRIGVHTGPCVAGITGMKTPRYLLFGETVNVATRMEATGAPLRIHVSATTAHILMESWNYHLTVNGDIATKAGPSIKTYWLDSDA